MHRDITVFHTYDGNDHNRMVGFYFYTTSDSGDINGAESFDIRGLDIPVSLSCERFADHDAILRHAIDTGQIEAV